MGIQQTGYTAERFIKSAFAFPNLFLCDIDDETRYSTFVHLTREVLRSEPFLDERIKSRIPVLHQIHTDVLLGCFKKIRPECSPLRYVFHTAFCGSTLLANCLDKPRVCLAYKEPYACTALSSLKMKYRSRGIPSAKVWEDLMKMCAFFLSRTFARSETALIKQHNMCTFSLDEFIAASPPGLASGVFLYSDLHTFLSSVFKSSSRRLWCRHFSSALPCYTGLPAALAKVRLKKLSDAKTAAYLWVAKMYAYMDFAGTKNARYVKALDSAMLFNEPFKALTCVAGFFDLSFSRADIRKIIAGASFTTYSKSLSQVPKQRFTRSDREAILERDAARFAGEIREGLAWAEKITRQRPIPRVLPNTLAL